MQRTIQIQTIETPETGWRRHCATENTPGGVGNDIVKAALALIGDLIDDSLKLAITPFGNRTASHEQQKLTIGLNGKAANCFTAVTLFVLARRRIVTE